jgi:hypothetical protein
MDYVIQWCALIVDVRLPPGLPVGLLFRLTLPVIMALGLTW